LTRCLHGSLGGAEGQTPEPRSFEVLPYQLWRLLVYHQGDILCPVFRWFSGQSRLASPGTSTTPDSAGVQGRFWIPAFAGTLIANTLATVLTFLPF
jgi:hypothetical protein